MRRSLFCGFALLFACGLAGLGCKQGLGGRCVQASDCESGICSSYGESAAAGQCRASTTVATGGTGGGTGGSTGGSGGAAGAGGSSGGTGGAKASDAGLDAGGAAGDTHPDAQTRDAVSGDARRSDARPADARSDLAPDR